MIEFYLQDDSGQASSASSSKPQLDRYLLEAIRCGEYAHYKDPFCALSLLELIWDELSCYVPSQSSLSISDRDLQLAQMTLVDVLGRLGLEFEFPWKNFQDFPHHYYDAFDGLDEELHELFDPIRMQLEPQVEKKAQIHHVSPITHDVGAPW